MVKIMTATEVMEVMERINLRRLRAAPLIHRIMETVRQYIPREDWREASWALQELLESAGVEVLTDEMREEAGLSPRGPDGWTLEEIIALEKRRIDAMLAPIMSPPVYIIPKK